MADQKKLNIRMKKQYQDKITGAIGVATAFFDEVDVPRSVRLENETNCHWYTISRLQAVPKAPKVAKPRKTAVKKPVSGKVDRSVVKRKAKTVAK